MLVIVLVVLRDSVWRGSGPSEAQQRAAGA
jgi:hypothetical protein